MRHCDNEYFVFVRMLDQAVRKSAQAAAPDVLAERMPGGGKLTDSFDGCNRFEQKRVAKAGDLPVVIRDCFVELLAGDFEKTNVHFTRYLARTSSSPTARISPLR